MSPTQPRSQPEILYSITWTRAVDYEFICEFRSAAHARGAKLTSQDKVVIRNCIRNLNKKFRSSFTYEEGKYWFRKFEKRYEAVTFIKVLPYVIHDDEENTIHVNWCMWDYIMLRHPIAESYFFTAEPNWPDLCKIFGDPVPAEQMHVPEIIQISDSSNLTLRNATHSIESIASPIVQHSAPPPSSMENTFWNNLSPINSVGAGSSHDSNNIFRTPPHNTTHNNQQFSTVVGSSFPDNGAVGSLSNFNTNKFFHEVSGSHRSTASKTPSRS